MRFFYINLFAVGLASQLFCVQAAENISSNVSPALNMVFKIAKEGNYETAYQIVNTYISKNPEDPRGYKTRGHLNFNKNNYSEALTDFTKVIELSPKSANAYVDRAGLYYAMDDYDKALLDIEKALEIKPKSSFALMLKEGISKAKNPGKHLSYRVREKGEQLRK